MSWMGAFFAACLGGFVGCMIYSLAGISGRETRLEEAFQQGVRFGIAKAEARRMVALGQALEADEEAMG